MKDVAYSRGLLGLYIRTTAPNRVGSPNIQAFAPPMAVGIDFHRASPQFGVTARWK